MRFTTIFDEIERFKRLAIVRSCVSKVEWILLRPPVPSFLLPLKSCIFTIFHLWRQRPLTTSPLSWRPLKSRLPCSQHQHDQHPGSWRRYSCLRCTTMQTWLLLISAPTVAPSILRLQRHHLLFAYRGTIYSSHTEAPFTTHHGFFFPLFFASRKVVIPLRLRLRTDASISSHPNLFVDFSFLFS